MVFAPSTLPAQNSNGKPQSNPHESRLWRRNFATHCNMRVALAVAVAIAGVALGSEPNPPVWPSSVHVFHPADTDVAAIVEAAFATNGGHDPPNHGQFSDARYAFLFMPGTYTTDVPVGYYTSIYGLGTTPDMTVFAGSKGVYRYAAAASCCDALSRLRCHSPVVVRVGRDTRSGGVVVVCLGVAARG